MSQTLKMTRKPVKLQKENPAGCSGEGKQSKGNYKKRKGRFKDNRQQHFMRKKVTQIFFRQPFAYVNVARSVPIKPPDITAIAITFAFILFTLSGLVSFCHICALYKCMLVETSFLHMHQSSQRLYKHSSGLNIASARQPSV